MAGTTEGARRRWRRGIPWPKCCQGKGKFQHAKGCHPSRPKCHWRRVVHPRWQTCNCGTPGYPHRIGTIDFKAGVCTKHKRHDQIMFELVFKQDWYSGERLDNNELNSSQRWAAE